MSLIGTILYFLKQRGFKNILPTEGPVVWAYVLRSRSTLCDNQSVELTHLPREVLQSSTVEALIAQNEDLSARLKVSLRKLSVLETEKEKLSNQLESLRQQFNLLDDQIQILQEKDASWKKKWDQILKEREGQEHRILHLQQLLENAATAEARFRKYQEKIKTQVKPYVQSLKSFCEEIKIQNQQLQSKADEKEPLCNNLQFQILEVHESWNQFKQNQEQRLQTTIRSSETAQQNLQTLLQDLTDKNASLARRNFQLENAQNQVNELENQVIALQRNNEILQTEASAKNDAVELRKSLERTTQDQLEQIDNLRRLWKSKDEEAQQYKLRFQALEKLNLELSKALQKNSLSPAADL